MFSSNYSPLNITPSYRDPSVLDIRQKIDDKQFIAQFAQNGIYISGKDREGNKIITVISHRLTFSGNSDILFLYLFHILDKLVW